MESIIGEITKLRRGRPLLVERHNSNRYRLVAAEDDGSRTAYCFGTPIYNNKTGRITSLKFSYENDAVRAIGSSANITLSQNIIFESDAGVCTIPLSDKYITVDKNAVRYRDFEVYPTLNGLAVRADAQSGGSFSFKLISSKPFLNIRANNKCFSLMSEEFRPFATVSCIGTLDAGGHVISPALLGYQKLDDRGYLIEIKGTSQYGKYLFFEVNLFEPKLFLDTTVESGNPDSNNAFGGTAFIGNTALYGEQWMYSRPDFSRIPELAGRPIERAVLHLPQHNYTEVLLSAYRAANRFCSFGSSWNNRSGSGELAAYSEYIDGYQTIDITNLFTEPKTKFFTRSDGLILKTKVKDSGFSVLSTCDSYYAPQILEIRFR